jgi:L-lactate dehydrogenase complex protein LldF
LLLTSLTQSSVLSPHHSLEIPAIRQAAQRALIARDSLLADYPDWEIWRRQARTIKTHVIAHLDDYLDQLQSQVEAWGGQVLRAADGPAAVALIRDLARRHQVGTLVKSKSMTTEEIGLNAGLEADGFQVTETDLGEFIVQLAGDTPAHITAPAMHLNRDDIADLFSRRLHLPRQNDPVVLSRQGAGFLQPRFWEAQMGITGVNFAAAATGHLVMLENEGNLRLSAYAPPVHVALMGLEKIIPTLADLEPFLHLLPASATGQRLTAYVNFIRALKPQPRGTQAFYLIILDNGRRRLAADPIFREALFCLRCGACLNICPIFQLGGGHLYGRVYPGAIGILLAPYLGNRADLTDLCTQCGACSQICQAGIELAAKINRLRTHSRLHPVLQAFIRAGSLVLAHPRWYRALTPVWRFLWRYLPPQLTTGCWNRHRALPYPAPRSFFESLPPEHRTYSHPGSQKALFPPFSKGG